MSDTLQQILTKLDNMSSEMATRDDLEGMKRTTKDELEEIKRTMATRDDLEEIKQTMATKDELNGIKVTLVEMGSRLEIVYQQVVRNSELISMKADKEEVNNINKRLDFQLIRISKLEEEVTLIKQTR